MYLLGYDEDVFREIESESLAFAGKLDVADLTIIPISALNGDNVVARSENMPWYDGTSLLHHLENVYIGSDRELRDVRPDVDVLQVEEQRSEEHTSELQSRGHLVCRLLLEKKKFYVHP